MPQPRRIALLVALWTLLLATAAGGRAGAASPPVDEMFWLGPFFAGLRSNATPEDLRYGEFTYGECELPEGEGGCSYPLDVRNSTTCDENPLRSEEPPDRLFLLRGGGLAVEYEPTWVEVGSGLQNVIVNPDEFELMGAALREVRRRSEPAPGELAPPVYPLPVLRELKRVTVLAARAVGVPGIARATELPATEVRLRLQVAALLGPDALADVPAPTMSTATVERLEQVAFHSEYRPARYARRHGIPPAELRKKVRRVRGLSGRC